MSLIHNIIPKVHLDIDRLHNFIVNIKDAVFESRGAGTFYYWIDGKSTRGFDITIYEEYIEVRNTILSSKEDYELTNIIVEEILKLTNGILVDEEEELVEFIPLFSNDRIIERELRDCDQIKLLSKVHADITIFGPKRKVHFGKRLNKGFKALTNEQLKEEMFKIILTVNYHLPNFEQGMIMEVDKKEEGKKILKLLTNETDYIIEKYDYILLKTSDDKPIIITNQILNTMLPSNWTLVDEFTIVAPITSKKEWEKLLNNAKKFDQFDNF